MIPEIWVPGSLSNPVEPRVLDVSASRTPLPGVLETLLPDSGHDPGAFVMVRDGVDTLAVSRRRGVAQVPLPLGFGGSGVVAQIRDEELHRDPVSLVSTLDRRRRAGFANAASSRPLPVTPR